MIQSFIFIDLIFIIITVITSMSYMSKRWDVEMLNNVLNLIVRTWQSGKLNPGTLAPESCSQPLCHPPSDKTLTAIRTAFPAVSFWVCFNFLGLISNGVLTIYQTLVHLMLRSSGKCSVFALFKKLINLFLQEERELPLGSWCCDLGVGSGARGLGSECSLLLAAVWLGQIM